MRQAMFLAARDLPRDGVGTAVETLDGDPTGKSVGSFPVSPLRSL
jgi:hypothetical protein